MNLKCLVNYNINEKYLNDPSLEFLNEDEKEPKYDAKDHKISIHHASHTLNKSI